MWRIQHSAQMAGARLVWFGLIEVIFGHRPRVYAAWRLAVPKCLPSRLPPPFALSTFHFPLSTLRRYMYRPYCPMVPVPVGRSPFDVGQPSPLHSEFQLPSSPRRLPLRQRISRFCSPSPHVPPPLQVPRRNLLGNVHVHTCYGIYM